jgi:alpha-galactosidase
MDVITARNLKTFNFRWRRLFAQAIFFTMLLSVRPALAQTNLSGYWIFRVPNGDGTTRDSFIQFASNNETADGTASGSVSGAVSGRGPAWVPFTGTFKEGQLHFVTQPPPGPASLPAGAPPPFPIRPQVYDGKYQDGKLLLQTQNPRQGLIQGVAERTTREATLPPAPLPLPQLKELPDNGLTRTPPMGWNSWNKFAGKVDDASVREMADAMVSSGMSKAGYIYINIDDTWEGGRDAAGNIVSNRKFPDMKALADYVHAKGLKIGIYSSPGPKTCAAYEGSFGHEVQDAKTFAAWGIDYLKYDLCSARTIYKSTPETLQALYQKMGEALQDAVRPIVYSLCQYGYGDVCNWGAKAGGNLWRTTDDIRDNWASMDHIGFSQIAISQYTRPGHWNDPDMLEIGNGGMNADEYRTHMSLWSLLSAPLLAGNDLRSMSEETKSILMNSEVIAVDQDPAAKPVQLLSQTNNIEVLMRRMQNGSVIVGVFNRRDSVAQSSFSWASVNLGAPANLQVRDLWSHKQIPVTGDSYSAAVPAHGVILLKVSAAGKTQ